MLLLTASLDLVLTLGVGLAGPADTWTTRIAFVAPAKLGGCAVGELDPRGSGPEIAAVSEDGRCWVVRREGGAWIPQEAHRAQGELIQCAVGDVDPSSPGEELLAVGMLQGTEDDAGAGAAWVIARRGESWSAEQVHVAPRLLHAAAVFEGAAFVAGFDRRVTRLSRAGGEWQTEFLVELPGDAKSMVPARGGVAVACTDGSVLLLRRGASGWSSEVIDRRASPRSRLGAQGELLAVSDDDGTLSLLGPGERREVFRSSDRLRGAVVADLDPDLPGLELATAGYTGEVSVITALEGETPRVLVPFVDVARLHHLSAGNLDDDPGTEIVASGYSGLLVVIDRRP